MKRGHLLCIHVKRFLYIWAKQNYSKKTPPPSSPPIPSACLSPSLQWLQQQCRRGRNFIGFKLTISNFTPKPHTPFQWYTQNRMYP